MDKSETSEVVVILPAQGFWSMTSGDIPVANTAKWGYRPDMPGAVMAATLMHWV